MNASSIRRLVLPVCATLAALTLGCPSPIIVPPKPVSAHPAWADTDECPSEYKGATCAVGTYTAPVDDQGKPQNMKSARRFSDEDARAALARLFQSKTTELVSMFNREVQRGGKGGVSDDASKAATEMFRSFDVKGASIINRSWVPEERTHYSLAKMDADAFKKALQSYKTLSDELRKSIENDADKYMDKLNERRESERRKK